jgi:hypothetical protein
MQNSASAQMPVKASSSHPIRIILIFLLILFIVVAGVKVVTSLFGLNPVLTWQTTRNTHVIISTQAPATPTITQNTTANWNTYTDQQAGFTLSYPPTVVLNEDSKEASKPVLSISVEKLADIPEDLPGNMGADYAREEQKRLQTGAGEQIFSLGAVNGQLSAIYSMFEVCSVMFYRKLTFYPGDYRVIVALSGPEEQIMDGMPAFFTIDKTQCGGNKMWDRSYTVSFEHTLADHKGSGMGQIWYDAFDQIIKTIKLSSPRIGYEITLAPQQPTSPACDVSDNAFCNVLSDIKQSLTAKNYQGLLAYQLTQSVTCDPEGMFVAVCDGAAKGVVKEGYMIGYNQSEGSLLTENNFIKTLSTYVSTMGPFRYQGSLVTGDKGIAVFLNPKKDKILVFPMHRTGATWRMDHVLIGGTFGNTSFENLSANLLTDY